jgi:thiol-activated cytolysin
MLQKVIKQTAFTGLMILLLFSSCSKDDGIDLSSFDGVVASGGSFEPVTDSETELATSMDEEIIDGVKWNCTTRTVKAEAAGGGQGGFPSFNPNASVIYPGNLLQGASLDQATPDIIAVERAGGTISTDVIDGNIAPFFEVDQVSKSQVSQALNNIIANSTGIIPANFDFKYYNVQSEEEFALKARMSIKTLATSFKGKLDFSSEKKYNRYFVTLNQSYYTMSYDIPTSLEQVFDPSVTPADLAKYTGPGNPACYISDVTYGRIFTMMIESTSSVTDMEAAVSGAFRGIGAKVKGEVEVDYFKSLNELKIQVFAFGGKDAETLETIGTQGNLNRLVDILAEASDIRTGKPLSYVVRSVYDNQIVSVKLATEYDVKECIPTVDPNAPPYTRHWAGLSAEFGGIGAAYCPSGTKMILINLEGTHYMESDIGTLEGPFPISRLAGGETCPVDGIGAICSVDGNIDSDGWAMCIDHTGSKYFYLRPGSWGSNPPDLIANMAYGTHPFKVDGVGALAFKWVTSDGPAARTFFNYTGDLYSIYTNNPQKFYSPHTIRWYEGDTQDNPLSSVGAAIGFYLGADHVTIMFDKLGTSYTVYSNGKTVGPYKI